LVNHKIAGFYICPQRQSNECQLTISRIYPRKTFCRSLFSKPHCESSAHRWHVLLMASTYTGNWQHQFISDIHYAFRPQLNVRV